MSVAVFMPGRWQLERNVRLASAKRLPETGWNDGRQQRTLPGSRILLVEDDYLLAFDLLGELLRCGAEVIGAVRELDTAFQMAMSELRIDAALIAIRLHGEFVFPFGR